jgi:hypothetical protein
MIKDVKIGDIIDETGSRVTGFFKFNGFGQSMVYFKRKDNPNMPIFVSNNHYIYHNNTWKRSDEHPDATDGGKWGTDELICLNTSDHTIYIGGHLFRDYDETEQADKQTMMMIENMVNRTNITEKDYKFKEITIQCNKDWTKVAIPTLAEFVSANPGECIFPGFANYGEGDGNFPGSKAFTFGDTDAAFTGEKGTGDGSKIMINVRYINDVFRNLGTVNEKGERSPDMSIAKFLNDIFTMIYKNSAQLFKLTLVINPKKETELVIVDSEYADEKIKPYVISAVDQDGIVRTMSLTAKIPQEMAAQAFIKAQSTLSPGQGLLTGREDKAQEPIPEALVAVKKKVASDGLTPENVTDLEAAIKSELIGKLGAANAPLFPLDFSCTLDGIEGFTFGNAITTNYLPAQYKRDDIAFTVTTVEHIIASGDWTTSLSTVCRFV